MANSSINLTSLDFDTIKSNLKTYLKSQSVFKDFDYEGSNMNVLLDVLSYNTYLNSFYLNMVASESFMDTAQIRDSVVSHAKEINYLPYSYQSAKATVNISFETSGITSGIFEIPKGTQFTGTNANGTFIFTNDTNLTVTSGNSTFAFANVDLYEGTYINETFIVDTSIELQKFVLSNPLIDTRSLIVTVYEDNGATSSDFIRTDSLYGVGSTSNVYFIQATQNDKYELIFGDGVFGRYPKNASTILATYRITQGASGSGVGTLSLNKDLGPYNGGTAIATITTTEASTNGSDRESMESIRFRAPRAYQSQGRAVTTSDYRDLILNNFPGVKDVSVYGGEDTVDAVDYGKVYISPTSFSGTSVTDQTKAGILDYLYNKKIINIRNEIVDPEYIDIETTISASVDFATTSLSPSDITRLIKSSILTYNDTYLKVFDASFRYSKFLAAITSSDTSIYSAEASLTMYKLLVPELNQSISLSTYFRNAIVPGTVYSSYFVLSDGYTYQIVDYNPNNDTFSRTGSYTDYTVVNDSPVLYLKLISTNNTESYTKIGTIDYDTGKISVKNLVVTNFLTSSGIKINATPVDMDIFGKRNNIVQIDTGAININIVKI